MGAVTGCDQVYSCLWSHAGWTPGHIHYVLQPAWDADRERFDEPGPTAQSAMFRLGRHPSQAERADAADRVRAWLADRGDALASSNR